MENYYKHSATIKGIEKACDLSQVGYSLDQNASRKRTRESLEGVEMDDLFNDIYKEIVFNSAFPTFRTYVLNSFYLLLSYNEDNEYYNEVMECVLKFREITSAADKELYKGNLKNAYFILVDNMIPLLKQSSQLILLFHLGARSVPSRLTT